MIMRGETIRFVTDRGVEQCHWAGFYKVLTRDWRFETTRSEQFRGVKGTLSVDVEGCDLIAYDRGRALTVRREVEASRRVRARL